MHISRVERGLTMLRFEMVEMLQNPHTHQKVLLIPLDLLPNRLQPEVELDIHPPRHLRRCLDGRTMNGDGHRRNRGRQ